MTIHAFIIDEDGDASYCRYASLDDLVRAYDGDIERVIKDFGAATFEHGRAGGILIEGVVVKPWPKQTVTTLELLPVKGQ
jgi:hypothetical protein